MLVRLSSVLDVLVTVELTPFLRSLHLRAVRTSLRAIDAFELNASMTGLSVALHAPAFGQVGKIGAEAENALRARARQHCGALHGGVEDRETRTANRARSPIDCIVAIGTVDQNDRGLDRGSRQPDANRCTRIAERAQNSFAEGIGFSIRTSLDAKYAFSTEARGGRRTVMVRGEICFRGRHRIHLRAPRLIRLREKAERRSSADEHLTDWSDRELRKNRVGGDSIMGRDDPKRRQRPRDRYIHPHFPAIVNQI